MSYSKPRAEVTKYSVYPTGYDQSPFADTHHFLIYVEQFPDTGRWRIHDGFNHGYLASHKGNWVRDEPLNRQWTRFDTAEAALAVALVAIDSCPGNRNLVDAIESAHGRRIAAEQEARA